MLSDSSIQTCRGHSYEQPRGGSRGFRGARGTIVPHGRGLHTGVYYLDDNIYYISQHAVSNLCVWDRDIPLTRSQQEVTAEALNVVQQSHTDV